MDRTYSVESIAKQAHTWRHRQSSVV